MLVAGFITVKSDSKYSDRQREGRLQGRGCVDLGKEVTEAKGDPLQLLTAPLVARLGGESSTQQRGHLPCGRATQHSSRGGCPLSSLSRATNPSLSSHNSVCSSLLLPEPRMCGRE